jgi:hypothetical protein
VGNGERLPPSLSLSLCVFLGARAVALWSFIASRPNVLLTHLVRDPAARVYVCVIRPATAERLLALYQEAYRGEPLVRVQADVPLVRDNSGRHHVAIGGTAV